MIWIKIKNLDKKPDGVTASQWKRLRGQEFEVDEIENGYILKGSDLSIYKGWEIPNKIVDSVELRSEVEKKTALQNAFETTGKFKRIETPFEPKKTGLHEKGKLVLQATPGQIAINVVNKFIGPISPVGETNEDDRRLENLKQLIAVAESLLFKIKDVADYRRDHRYSMKAAGKEAFKFLKAISEEINVTIENAEEE